MRFLLWGLVIAFSLNSCMSDEVFEDVADFENHYWLADSVKHFEFEIMYPEAEYQILLNLRNGIEYPHSNIYVQYAIMDSTERILDEELRNFQLFHPKSGHPFGNGSGNIKEHKFDLIIGYKFPNAGKYQISFEQFMRYDSLPQIYSVGVTVKQPSN